MALQLPALIHQLRFYIGDYKEPFSYEDEELETYLTSGAQRIGLGDPLYDELGVIQGAYYQDWTDIPGRYSAIIVKFGYLNWLLKRGAGLATTAGTRVEDLETQSGAGTTLIDLIRATRQSIMDDLADLGINVPDIVMGECLKLDRSTHTYAPYNRTIEPPVPMLSNTDPTTGAYTLRWTRYTKLDFYMYILEVSQDGIVWNGIFSDWDNHHNSFDLANVPSGTYMYRVTTHVMSALKSVSATLTVTVP